MAKQKFVILPAGGSGRRAGSPVPKQFIEVAGRPILWWTMKAFHEEDPDTKICVLIHKDYIDYWLNLMMNMPVEDQIPHNIAPGGKDRVDSVAEGLRYLEAKEDDLIAIHDAARPLVSRDLIARGWEAAALYSAAVPVVPLTDSVRRLKVAGNLSAGSSSANRAELVAVQTPQVFRCGLLRMAYDHRKSGITYTDDASVVEAIMPIALFEGDPANIKVTNPGDFAIVESKLR